MRCLAAFVHVTSVWVCQASVLACQALRFKEGSLGSPAPHERRIQYTYLNHGGGLHDRLWAFTWLLRLGRMHNATTHILGGRGGARMFLNPKHSVQVSETWDTYFDTTANEGNPFHPVEDLPDCKTISDPETDLATIFHDGSACVNISISFFTFKHKYPWGGKPDPMIPASSYVRGAAARYLKLLPKAYGAIHIRRCDLLGESRHRECTAVDSVYDLVRRHDNFTAWFVSLYAEEGYREHLQKRLEPLKRRFMFEDVKRLAPPEFRGDNYFTFMVANEIKGNAGLILDSHHCPESTMMVIPGHVDGQWLQRRTEAVEANGRRGEGVDADGGGDLAEGWESSSEEDGATCSPGWA